MDPIIPRTLSPRILRLREAALHSPKLRFPNIPFRGVRGTLHLLGQAWKHFYQFVPITFSPDDLIPFIDISAPLPQWAEITAPLLQGEPENTAEPPLQSPWKDIPGLYIGGGNHTVPGYEQLLREGLPARRQRICRRLEAESDPDKIDFLQYLQYKCEGLIIFLQRNALALHQAAHAAVNADRRQEVLALATACAEAASGPVQSFRAALMLHHTIYQETADSPGCLDRYFEPYVQADLQRGTITEDTAFDYICAEYIRFFQTCGPEHQLSGASHLSLGGRLADGSSAVGLCTFLCMQAQASLKMLRPQIALRWAACAPDDFLLRGIELLRESSGVTDFSNDEVFIPALVNAGIAEGDARTYSPSGCNEIMIPGLSQMGALQGHFNLPLILNILLGQKTVPGLTIPPLDSLATFDDLRRAFRTLQQDFFRFLHRFTERVDRARIRQFYLLHLSLYTDDCIDRARPIQDGGARYNGCNFDVNGIVNLADSLHVIRRLVYQQKRLTLSEFADILKHNWAGHDSLRAEIKTRITHFGNDDDEVDSLAAELFHEAAVDFDSEPPLRGGHYNMGTLGGYENAHVELAKLTAATPDGRLDGEPFASGLSPWASMDKNGPTALLKSIAKIPFDHSCTSMIVNTTLAASTLNTPDGRQLAAKLLETYFRNGGIQLQITVADRELLLAAEREPENYQNLLVRVSGYSARFLALKPEVRAEIIRRTVWP